MWITCFTLQKVKCNISWTLLHAIWSHSQNVNIMYLFINFMQQKKLIRCSTNHSTVLLYRPYSLKKNCQCYQYHIIIVINILTIINIIFIIITIIITIVLLFLSASLFANGIISVQLRFLIGSTWNLVYPSHIMWCVSHVPVVLYFWQIFKIHNFIFIFYPCVRNVDSSFHGTIFLVTRCIYGFEAHA